jgi:dephospho-CoA kinase
MSYIVGLTGGIGCGKSIIEKYFAERGAHIIDTDVIAHQLQEPGQAGFVYIKETFGDRIINLDGTLNRAALRKIVFNDKDEKAKLQAIMSPLIYHCVLEQIAAYEEWAPRTYPGIHVSQQPPYIILTVPLLFESKVYTRLIDRSLVIDCPEHVQIDRVMKRSGLRRNEVEKIINAQAPRYFRVMKADDIIHNYEGPAEEHRDSVNELHNFYANRALEKSGNVAA